MIRRNFSPLETLLIVSCSDIGLATMSSFVKTFFRSLKSFFRRIKTVKINLFDCFQLPWREMNFLFQICSQTQEELHPEVGFVTGDVMTWLITFKLPSIASTFRSISNQYKIRLHKARHQKILQESFDTLIFLRIFHYELIPFLNDFRPALQTDSNSISQHKGLLLHSFIKLT